MIFETNKDRGRAGLSLAIAYFGANGYTVNLPLNDTQWYDLVIEKNGKFETVQCKATGSTEGEVSLKSMGGTSGNVYDTVLEHPLDWLFCINQNGDMFNIPMQVLRDAGNVKSIRLRTEPPSRFATNLKLDTSQYRVFI